MSIVWLKIKSAITNWCKKYWQILVGFFGAVLAFLVFRGGSTRDVRKALDAKNELYKKEQELEKILRDEEDQAIKENIERYFITDDKVKADFHEKLKALDNKQKKRVKELLDSDKPEEAIVEGLRKFLE